MCGAEMPVVALLAPNVDGAEGEPCVLSNIIDLPKPVLSYIQQHFPTFQLKYSKTIGRRYFANTCPKCGVISGDFYFHDEPGAPFFPTEDKEAQCLEIETIPVSGPVTVVAASGFGTGDLILRNAKRHSGTGRSTRKADYA